MKRILVTGEQDMIHRHRFLFEAMASQEQGTCFQYLPSTSVSLSKPLKRIAKPLVARMPFISDVRASSFRKHPDQFIARSYQTEQKIRAFDDVDLVFHIYAMFAPFWNRFNIPYVIYLDYTMALAHRNWRPWAPFKDESDLMLWLQYETRTYQEATHIFTKSNNTKKSLVNDYGISPAKISVILSSGNFKETYSGQKKFGSKKILFNASDFKRKGGPLLIEAFRRLRARYPEVQLVIVGDKITPWDKNIKNLGYVSSKNIMERIFLETDLVVSPALCEPLGLFLIEAMNYGVPCIVSNQDGMPEIIQHEMNGLVLNDLQSTDIQSSIQYLISNPQLLKKMSNNARQYVKENLTWDIVASKILKTLDAL